ncbi:MAG: cysteine desulfurase [Candidatus Nanopelagicaceae bacterium]|jgi:cysteine desulfurase/selenocysteine lyase
MSEALDVARIKRDFPIFERKVNDHKLVYLDSAATSQKPFTVLDAERDFYTKHNAAAHRGAHRLAEEATEFFENARASVATFLNGLVDEIIFTKSATEAINLVAYSLGNADKSSQFYISEGDEILVSEMEHHANLVPWQELARRSGAKLKWLNVTDEGRIDLSDIESKINKRTRVIALTHQSNVLGTINDFSEISKRAQSVGALLLIDACQSAPHFKINVAELGCDFLTFSGHKALGPTGIGVLWGKKALLDAMPPFLTGGSMIEMVTMESSTYLPAPRRFEPGVPNMAQAIGLAAGLKYLTAIGLEKIHDHEMALTKSAIEGLKKIPGVKIIGPEDLKNRGGVVSFELDGIHPHDLGQALDQYGIAVRTGHHCAWPLMRRFNSVATTRASFYLYNDLEDIEIFISGVQKAENFFKGSKKGLK